MISLKVEILGYSSAIHVCNALSLSLSLSNALSFGFYSGDGLLISEKF